MYWTLSLSFGHSFCYKIHPYQILFLSLLGCVAILGLWSWPPDKGSASLNGSYVNFTLDKIEKTRSISTHSENSLDSVQILFWSPFYSQQERWFWWFQHRHLVKWCPDQINCSFTIDRNLLNTSHALVFHGYVRNLNLSDMPPYRYPNQRWIYFNNEPPEIPFRNMSEFDGLFNWTMTYRTDSDIYGGYGKFFMEDGNITEINYAKGKTRLVAWFVSHCRTYGGRENFVAELQKYIPKIDIFGDCAKEGNFTCKKRDSHECYSILHKHYKFYLSFENIICKDYITEKYWRVLSYNVVPVVFGNGYERIAVPGSYIDALKFRTPKLLAEYLMLLDKNDTLYNKYFEWKRGKTVTVLGNEVYSCEICKQVRNVSRPPKVYRDLNTWWNKMSSCKGWKNGVFSFMNNL